MREPGEPRLAPGLSAKERCFDACRGARIGEAKNPGPPIHGDPELRWALESDVDSECWPDPELQWALEDGAERGEEPFVACALSRPPAPPELEEAARGMQARLQAEIGRLRRQGIPAEHTWSAVLVPTIWLSLPVYCHRLLLPALVREAVDLRPARQLASFWQRQGVQLPGDLFGWLHGRDDMGQCSGALLAFGYLAAGAQERM